MVPPLRFELRTPALSRRCSNQLSYGGIVWYLGKESNLTSYDYQSYALPLSYLGINFFGVDSRDRTDAIPESQPGALTTWLYPPQRSLGGSSKIRTYDRHRMKMLHYHFAILPIIELYTTLDLLSSLVPTFSLELNLPRYEGGVPPTNTSRAMFGGRCKVRTCDLLHVTEIFYH